MASSVLLYLCGANVKLWLPSVQFGDALKGFRGIFSVAKQVGSQLIVALEVDCATETFEPTAINRNVMKAILRYSSQSDVVMSIALERIVL